MTKKEYNGWFNYETWLANIWYDGSFQDKANEIWEATESEDFESLEDRRSEAISRLEDMIKETIESNEDIPTGSSFVADLINGALSEVNYREIAARYIDDLS